LKTARGGVHTSLLEVVLCKDIYPERAWRCPPPHPHCRSHHFVAGTALSQSPPRRSHRSVACTAPSQLSVRRSHLSVAVTALSHLPPRRSYRPVAVTALSQPPTLLQSPLCHSHRSVTVTSLSQSPFCHSHRSVAVTVVSTIPSRRPVSNFHSGKPPDYPTLGKTDPRVSVPPRIASHVLFSRVGNIHWLRPEKSQSQSGPYPPPLTYRLRSCPLPCVLRARHEAAADDVQRPHALPHVL